MSGSRRGFLKGLIGTAATTALTPNQLMKAASGMNIPPVASKYNPQAFLKVSEDGRDLIYHALKGIYDNMHHEAHDLGWVGNNGYFEPDEDNVEHMTHLRKLEDLLKRMDNEEAPRQRDKETLEYFLGGQDPEEILEIAHETMADLYSDSLGLEPGEELEPQFNMTDLKRELRSMKLNVEGLTFPEGGSPKYEPAIPDDSIQMNPEGLEPEEFDYSLEENTPQLGEAGQPSVSLNAPTRGLLPAEASANPEALQGIAMRDDNAQRSLPAPEKSLRSNGFHRKALESDLEDPEAFPDWGDDHDLSAEHFDKLTRATFPDDDSSPHEVTKEWAQSSTSRAVNARLREGKGGDLEDTHIRNLDSLFHQHAHEFDKPTTLYRAMPAKNLGPDNLEGKHLHDRGLLPLTTTPRRALEYFNDYGGSGPVALMRVKVSPGDKALFPDRHLRHLGQPAQGENEVLLPRGARLSIKSHTQSVLRNQETRDGRRQIHFLDVELIGHE